MKRLVSIFMALAMIFTSAIVEFPVTTLTVQAAGGVGNSLGSQGAAVAASQAKSYPVNDYPYESDSHIREKDPNDNYESFNHYADAYNFYMGECTSFAAWRIRDVHGINFTNWYGGVQWGDAKNWGNAAEQVRITVDSTPAIGSVGFFTNGRHGHVVWVYGIDGNNVLIEEYNSNEKGWWWSDKYGCCHMYNTRSAPKSSFKYIHFEKLSQKPSTPSEPHGTAMTTGAGYTIPNGEYHITAHKDQQYGITVSGVSHDNGADVDLWNDMHTENHVFIVTYLNNGFYKIINKTTGKALDVGGVDEEKTLMGANVQQYEYHGGDCQQWSIESASDGAYWIRSKCNGWYVDLADEVITPGQDIRMWVNSNVYAQGWHFVPWGKTMTSGAGRTISDGEYHITAYKNPEYGVTVRDVSYSNGANIDLWNDMHTTNHIFVITYLNNGFYKIINKTTGKSLDVADASKSQGANVQQYEYHGGDCQQWSIESASDGAYWIRSKCNGWYVDLVDAFIAQGQNIRMWESSNVYAQGWRLDPWYFVPVTGFSGKATSDSITLSWNQSAVADGYEIAQLINGQYPTIASITNSFTTSYTVSGLAPDTEYTFSICATKNTSRTTLTWITIKTAPAPNPAPAAVTGFTGTANTNSIALKWNNSANATSYELQQQINGSWKTIATLTRTSYTVTGLTANTSYNFRISAKNSGEQSAQTNLTVKTNAALTVSIIISKPTQMVVTNIQLKVTQNNKQIAAISADSSGKANISAVPNGTYTFAFSAANCAPRTYTVSISDGKLTGLANSTAELRLYGDINGDGKINATDILKAKLHAKGSQKLSAYDVIVADVTKDNKINSTDILKLKLHAKGSAKLW